jgi:transcriptional regulator with XRE-family HTH domain
MAPFKQRQYKFDPDSIKAIRQKLNLKQSDLAELVGDKTTKTTIFRWENGKSTPDADALAAIYSIAVQGGIMPGFFKKSDIQAGRSRLIVSWDFQNWSPATNRLKETSNLIKKTLTDRFPTATYQLFKLFTTDSSSNKPPTFDQWWATLNPKNTLTLDNLGWRVYQSPQNIDDELDTQSYSDCLQVPEETIFVLISRDGDFADLIHDLREKGVSTYLITPEGTSQKLIEAVGPKRWIQIPGIV